MSLQLNLEKSAETLKLCLQKVGIHTPPEVELCFNMDVSGSFEHEHRSGATNQLMNRLVPWGMVFDPDKKLDLFTFSSGERSAYYVGEVTADNCQDFIKKNVINNVPGWNGCTEFAHVIKKNLIQFGWITGKSEKQGFFSRVFSLKKSKEIPRKSLIIHVTDGEASDINATTQLLESAFVENYGVYVIFFGIGAGPRGESDINMLASRFKNVGSFLCKDIKEFIAMSDEDINNILITDELIEYLKG